MNPNPFESPSITPEPQNGSGGRFGFLLRILKLSFFWALIAGAIGVVLSIFLFQLTASDVFGRETLRELLIDLSWDLTGKWSDPNFRRECALQLPVAFSSIGFWICIVVQLLLAAKS